MRAPWVFGQQNIAVTHGNGAIARNAPRRHTFAEPQTISTLNSTVYKGYFRSIGGIMSIIIMICLLVFEQMSVSALDFFISRW